MTKEQLIDELLKLLESANGDPDTTHAMAENLLLHYIDDNDVMRAYEAIPKCYTIFDDQFDAGGNNHLS